ncbi:hypothetical protein Naga_102512g1 [Nannochloropsis gaditana]|uniref:Uncharacterized protein n=1 Tax=Nannochloropsis gaditana TaxID=72520 RepID=W7T929_9STRA|nr:hypothetical protein Naga_102512g1 [Nannochloropsis gaditana]
MGRKASQSIAALAVEGVKMEMRGVITKNQVDNMQTCAVGRKGREGGREAIWGMRFSFGFSFLGGLRAVRGSHA